MRNFGHELLYIVRKQFFREKVVDTDLCDSMAEFLWQRIRECYSAANRTHRTVYIK